MGLFSFRGFQGFIVLFRLLVSDLSDENSSIRDPVCGAGVTFLITKFCYGQDSACRVKL